MKRILLQTIVFCAFLVVIHSDKPRTRAGAQYWATIAETYLEDGLCEDAFRCYEDCIAEGSANAAVFYKFGELLLCSRNVATKFYGEDTQQIFDRAFLLFERALKADPMNWELAAKVARNHNLIQPWRSEEALAASERAISLARTQEQREEVQLDLARAQVKAGLNSEALETLALLRGPEHETFKRLLILRIDQQRMSHADNE